MLGKIESKRRRRWQRTRWLDSITDSIDMNLRKLREIVKDRKAWCAAVHGITKSQTKLSDWTTTTTYGIFPDQGLNLCPLYWQVDSYPKYYQGSPPSYPLYVYTTACLSTHLLVGSWVVTFFWLLWIMLQWTLGYKHVSFCFNCLGYISRSGIAGFQCLNCWGISLEVLIVLCSASVMGHGLLNSGKLLCQ